MVDVARHARHITLPNVGVEGQQRLSEASVLLIGAGGLGSPAALYLAAAGVGRIGLVDDDRVELSNLQRQIIHSTHDVGTPKVESAKATLEALDGNVEVVTFHTRLHPDNALELLRGWDIVLDGTDNLPTRYLIDDACSLLGLPWVYGSVFRFEGQVSLFNHLGGPCYRDLFPEAPPTEAVPSCADAGVFGVLPGVVGVLQATEAIKVLLGFEASLSGALLVYDALTMRFDTLTFARDPTREPVTDLSLSAAMLADEAWCSAFPEPNAGAEQSKSSPTGPSNMFHQITMAEVLQRKAEGWEPFILDVRSDQEYAQGHVRGCGLQIPHSHVLAVLDELPKKVDILIHCKAGMRSQLAAVALVKAGWIADRIYNLEGGIMAWQAMSPEDIVK
jgi:molybdopterin/thiamine biosynthesis adenylyltransferase/rhodanese-related sulfurtransferase